MRRITYLWCFVATIMVSGCAMPFLPACLNVAQSEKEEFRYTKDQAIVACSARALFYANPHLTAYDRADDKWKLNMHGLLTRDVEKVLKDQVESLDMLLSYQDKLDAQWIDWFKGFREGLEKAEQAALYSLGRLNFVRTYNEFVDAVGEPSSALQGMASYFFPAGRKFYSTRLLYPKRDPAGEIPFVAEYLETAKRDGVLRLVDRFDIVSRQEFAKKVPHLYDPNQFIWESHKRGWTIKSFMVMPGNEKPGDNIVHYIEVYRSDGGKEEEKPAVRGFLAAGAKRVSVFIVDYDAQHMAGHGAPDTVERTYYEDITTGSDIFFRENLKKKLLDALYENPRVARKEKPERKRPPEKPLYVSIKRMGEAKIDVWEHGDWRVPIDYLILPQSVELDFKKPETVDEKRAEERDKVKRIRAFRRAFKQDWNVMLIEYWLPKKEYGDQNISSAAASTDTFRIRRKNGPEETGEIGYFADRIRQIDYLFGGRWFRIIDEDGDGKFEKKRNISDPTKG